MNIILYLQVKGGEGGREVKKRREGGEGDGRGGDGTEVMADMWESSEQERDITNGTL